MGGDMRAPGAGAANGLRPLVIGHRGAPGYRPEHTRSSYELALALGADAVEPDLVASRDGVLVLRHENEISGTTDVAARPEFASRRTSREIDGRRITGWFTEDFTWAELATLRARERLPAIRRASASFDGRYPILRLRDLLGLLDRAADGRQACPAGGGIRTPGIRAPDVRTPGVRTPAMVAEFKHASHFAEQGLPLDELFRTELDAAGWGTGDGRIVMEAFEPGILDRLGEAGIAGPRVLLVERAGAPADLVRSAGSRAPAYDSFMTAAGLAGLAGRFDGVSVSLSRLLAGPADGRADAGARVDAGAAADAAGRPRASAPDARTPLTGAALIRQAHEAGLLVYTWTLRPENAFLAKRYRRGPREAWGRWPDEFARIIRTGVDGVFADHPDLAVDAIEEVRRADAGAEPAESDVGGAP
ncbi:glycerophosphodiester phosphodiesterase family protein [Agromyces archimandritae]|uniref:glycerophosphodiester phosphodiesterase n=1 Tax=Agromyces archimandritae TaxID=2781962 RepID=A0A975IPE3_9MICO|nr:glycerophosphodiester phosphodiesterase family protein [Agromyces archimandritae]QTX03906.1 glycerophosphodiester phosphodiesterase [Agromyces archimandritae]